MQNNYPTYISISASVIFSLLIGVMIILSPTYADDFWYLSDTTGTPGSWEYFTTTLHSTLVRATCDTSRLCNIAVSIFLGLTPKWVYALLTSAWTFFILRAPLRLLDIKPLSPLEMLWTLVIIIIFPWFDYMFTIVFSINYVWTIGFGLLWLLLFCNTPRQNLSKGYYTMLLVVGWITGWWHEGFSVPFAFGLFVYYLISRKRPNRQQLWLLIGLVVGILSLLSLPAIWNMVDDRKSTLVKPILIETLINIFAFDCNFYIFLLLTAISLIKSKMRKSFLGDSNFCYLVIAFIAGTLPAIYIYLKYYNGQRTGAFIQVSSALMMLVWFLKFVPKLASNKSWGAKVFATLTILFCFANLASSCLIQPRLTREFNEVEALAKTAKSFRNKKGKNVLEIYYDKTYNKYGIDLLKPSYSALNSTFGLNRIMLIPTELADFDVNNPEVKHVSDSMMIYRNRIISTTPDIEGRVLLEINTDKENQVVTRGHAMIFHDKFGNKLYYIEIRSLKFDENTKVSSAKLLSVG